tara:strand:+ start:1459 stop:2583 length:1125 start_codon:yes stop_codon:yes gene_type:complete
MNNQIFELNTPFDFKVINLGNPSLINNNNYFSKLSHGNINKNVYIQLPKCITKNGIVKNSNKTFCELNFSITDKNAIDFFENLEKFCIDQIYQKKELWFYNSDNLTQDDIEELFTPIIKTYKQGKRFLVKTHIKNDKFNIYDENERKIELENLNLEHEFIPLLNINGIKFSSKNFTIDLTLTQMMLIYPSDEFEKNILIKVDKTIVKDVVKAEGELVNTKDLINEVIDTDELDIEDFDTSVTIESLDESLEDSKNDNANSDKIVLSDDILRNSFSNNTDSKEQLNTIPQFPYLINNKLEEVNDLNLNEDISSFEIKSRESIYLEIYKKAKQKAQEIRKNAIEAFLDAKKIKSRYNLDSLLDSDSSDDEFFDLEK